MNRQKSVGGLRNWLLMCSRKTLVRGKCLSGADFSWNSRRVTRPPSVGLFFRFRGLPCDTPFCMDGTPLSCRSQRVGEALDLRNQVLRFANKLALQVRCLSLPRGRSNKEESSFPWIRFSRKYLAALVLVFLRGRPICSVWQNQQITC